MNGDHAHHVNGAAQPSRRRLPTCEEALQYSPFTSIFPFGLDIIDPPRPPPCTLPTIPLPAADVLQTKQTIGSFNDVLANPTETSARLEQTLRTLKHLLNSEDLTHYKLKTPPVLLPALLVDGQQQSDSKDTATLKPPGSHISPFAKMLLDQTDVAFRYPTPVSPVSGSRKDGASVSNRKAYNHNSQAHSGASLKEQHPPVSKSQSNGFAVVIPAALSSHTTHAHADRKNSEREQLPKETSQHSLNVDQKERAQVAFQTLQDLIYNIFSAEDQLEPDTSGLVPREAEEYFTATAVENETLFLLTSAIQTRLEGAITKLIQLGQFGRVPIDYLSRLQKICARSLCLDDNEHTESASDGVKPPSSDALQRADNCLRASKVLVRILTAGRDEKQIYADEILQKLLLSLQHILEDCVVPAVENRNGKGSINASWAEQKDTLTTVMQRVGRVLKLLGDLVLKIDLSESSINAIEYMSVKLLFVENASSEKESVLGIQKFEALRRHAMDVVSKVFLRYPEQRSPIFDEILTSLEKLPVGRQSARQFKIVDGKPIQLISALIMQLVQTSTMFTVNDKSKADGANRAHSRAGTESSDESESGTAVADLTSRPPNHRANEASIGGTSGTNVDSLRAVAMPLYNSAQINASYVVRYLISRAMTSSKSGDEPYRNLLDIFVEDFLSVLGSTDWPAAQLLLASLLSNLLGLVDNDKSTAPVRNMALELFGLMGSAIADLHNHLSKFNGSGEDNRTPLDQTLTQLCEETLEGNVTDRQLAARRGPLQVVVQFLGYRVSEGLQLQSAQSCTLVQWSRSVCVAAESSNSVAEDDEDDGELEADTSLIAWLRRSVLDPIELRNTQEFEEVSTQQGRMAYGIAVFNSPFCKAYPRILGTLLSSVSSPQPTVRNKSLKSVIQLLEKDPSILDRFPSVPQKILSCTADPSVQVRESALGLLGKCMTMKPALEVEGIKQLIRRTDDGSVGVRKRALKLLKEVYLRNIRRETRVNCTEPMLKRLEDVEESVAELASQTLEELWISSFYEAAVEPDPSPQTKQRLRDQVLLMIGVSQRGEHTLPLLALLIGQSLKETSKTAPQSRTVCKAMVNIIFDVIIDNDQKGAQFPKHAFLDVLTVFAKADPRLFTGDQMSSLRPYISHLTQGDDRAMYRAVIAIYRRVLPVLPPLQHDFLVGVHSDLFQHVSRLSKLELDEVTQCLWIIHGVLDNSAKLVRLLLSALIGIEASKRIDLSQPSEAQTLSKTKRYIMIAGHFGKNMNLDSHLAMFKEKLPSYRSDSCSGLLVDIMLPFTAVAQPISIREVALENILLVTQSWPKSFLKAQVNTVLEGVFKSREQRLELIILLGIKEFFLIEEERSKSGADIAVGDGAASGAERLGGSMILTDNDGASTAIAQRYLPYIMKISLSGLDDLALVATEVITSINRQGLVHPKDSCSTLVALETSSNSAISNKAFEEHRAQHLKHESMLEKEYLNAVEVAFTYQRGLLQDSRGSTSKNAAKLWRFYEVLKQGSPALRKRLLVNLCARLNFSMTKIDQVEGQLLYARFVLENLALFDYGRSDEIVHLIGSIEKIVTTTGSTVSQRIEAQLESTQNGDVNQSHVDEQTLRELTSASVVLSLFWETRNYLKRAWSLPVTNLKTKSATKDINKAPTRLASANPDRIILRMAEIVDSLRSADTMQAQCRAFFDAFMIDHDLRVTRSDEDDMELNVTRFETPDQDAMDDDTATQHSGGSRKSASLKRKGSVSVTGTPRKRNKAQGPKKARASLSRNSTVSFDNPDEEWV